MCGLNLRGELEKASGLLAPLWAQQVNVGEGGAWGCLRFDEQLCFRFEDYTRAERSGAVAWVVLSNSVPNKTFLRNMGLL